MLYGAEVVRLDHGRVPAAAELGEPRLSAAEAGPRRPLPAGRLLPPVQPEPLPGAAALPDAGDPPDAAAGETLRRPPQVRNRSTQATLQIGYSGLGYWPLIITPLLSSEPKSGHKMLDTPDAAVGENGRSSGHHCR